MQSESIAKLMPALLKAQKAIASVKKDSKNPHLKSNYASIEAVIDAIKLALNDNDIVFIQPLSMDNDKVTVVTRLIHISGEWIESRVALPPMQNKNDPQGLGGAITYARRYSLCSILGLSQEDDDGNSSSDLRSVDDLNKAVTAIIKECNLSADDVYKIAGVKVRPTDAAGLRAVLSLLEKHKESLNG